MNTADKSLALLDIALRRRFEFEPMYPWYDIEGAEIHDREVMQKINAEIIKKKGDKGYDYQIGHSFFMGKGYDLERAMNTKVIPLLMEYFMNDSKAVKEILNQAGLELDEEVWPIRIKNE